MYVVYGKHETKKRFSPIGSTGPVVNLVYAIMFETKEEAEKDCKSLQSSNPKWIFEVRKK